MARRRPPDRTQLHGEMHLPADAQPILLQKYRTGIGEVLGLMDLCPCRLCLERVALALGAVGYIVGYLEHFTRTVGGDDGNVERVLAIGREEARADGIRMTENHKPPAKAPDEG
jgi:hypothetical protein